MEKMLKHNNGLTGINTVLLLIVAAIIWQDHAELASQRELLTEVRAAMHYKFNTDVPYKNTSEALYGSRDIALTRKETVNKN